MTPRKPAHIERLQGAVTSFINAQSWFAAARVIDAQPALLEEGTPEVVAEVARSLGRDFPEEARAWEQCAVVLARCRQVGLQRAMAEMSRVRKLRPRAEGLQTRTGTPTPRALTAFLEADGSEAMRILEEHPEIATAEAIERIDEYIAHFRARGDTLSVRSLEARRDLLRRW